MRARKTRDFTVDGSVVVVRDAFRVALPQFHKSFLDSERNVHR